MQFGMSAFWLPHKFCQFHQVVLCHATVTPIAHFVGFQAQRTARQDKQSSLVSVPRAPICKAQSRILQSTAQLALEGNVHVCLVPTPTLTVAKHIKLIYFIMVLYHLNFVLTLPKHTLIVSNVFLMLVILTLHHVFPY